MKLENLIAIDIILSHKKADEGLAAFKAGMKGFTNSIDLQSNSINSAVHENILKYQKLGSTVAQTGDTLTKFISLPISAALMGAVNAARNYETAFAGVRKTVDATAGELAQLSEEIKTMSTEMPASAERIAGVAEVAGQLGIKVNDIEEFSKVMINIGVSTNIMADAAGESFARLFNIMGNASDEYEKAGSSLVYLGNNYATNEKQIMSMTMRLASAGKQADMSTADIMGMATGLSAMGLSAEAGGSAMSKFISNMNVAVNMGTGKLRELETQTGMTWREMQLMAENAPREFRSLAQSIGLPTSELKRFVYAGKNAQQMADVAGVSIDEFADIFKDNAAHAVGLFIEGLADAQDGIESMTLTGEDAITILQEMGISEVRLRDGLLRSANAGDLLTGAIKDSNNAWKENTALSREAGIRYETLDSQWEMFKNTLQLVAINLGEQMLPMLKDLIKWMKGFADNLANMDPNKFQAIAKGLMAMAAVGPSLKIAGKALHGFGEAHKVFNIVKNGLVEVVAETRNFANAYTGKWTDQSLNYMSQFGYKINSLGQVIRKDGTFAMQDFSKELEKTGIPMGKMTMRLGYDGLLGAFNKVMKSPIFQAGVWTVAIGYAASLFGEFEFLQKISKTLFEVFKNIVGAIGGLISGFSGLISKMTDGAASLKDVGILAGGLVLAFNPATAAVGAFIAATAGIKMVGGWIRGLGKGAEESVPSLELTTETIGNLNRQLDSVENAYTKFVEETAPQVREAYEGLHEKIQASQLSPESEELHATFADYQEYTTLIIDNASERRRLLREELVAGLEERGVLETEYGQTQLENFDKQSFTLEHEQTALNNKINALLRKQFEDGKVLNTEEEAELEAHLTRLEEITLTKQQEAFDKEFEQTIRNLEMRRALGYSLTEEEMDLLNNLMAEKLDQQHLEVVGRYKAQIDAIDEALKTNLISEEAHREQIMNVYREMFGDQLELTLDSAEEYLTIMTNMSKEEIKDALDKQAQIEQIDQELITHMLEHGKEADQALLNSLRDKKQHLQDEIKAINMTQDEWDGFTNYLKAVMPPEMQEMIKGIEDAIDFTGTFEIFDRTGEDLQEIMKQIGKDTIDGYTQGAESKNNNIKTSMESITALAIKAAEEGLGIQSPSTKFRTIGQYVGDGLIQGINNRQSSITYAAKNMAQNAYNAAKNVLGIKSPSRLFMGMGEFIPEGMAIGIERESKVAADAAKKMSEDIHKAAELNSQYTMAGVSDLKSYTKVSADSDFVQSIKTAVVEAFATSGPITAYIGKEEAQENFELNMLKSLTGKYNK